MNDIDAALAETDRAIDELRFRGVEIFTDINGKPVDSPEFMPLYEKMAAYNLPILLHPRRTNTTRGLRAASRRRSISSTRISAGRTKHRWRWRGWRSAARSRSIPTLKIVTHHAGGMIPYFHKRVQLSWDFNEMRMGYRHDGQTLTKAPVDYYRMFYCDTAIQGNTPALMCAYEFFGADHMVFATDTPYDNQLGERVTRETSPAFEAMPIDAASRSRRSSPTTRGGCSGCRCDSRWNVAQGFSPAMPLPNATRAIRVGKPAPHIGKMLLRRNIGGTRVGVASPRPVTRLRSIFRDRDGVLRTVCRRERPESRWRYGTRGFSRAKL